MEFQVSGIAYRNVRGNGIQVRLDGIVAKRLHNLGKEQRHALQRNTEADFDGEEAIGSRSPEDLEGLPEVELLVDDGGTIDEDAVVGEGLLVLVEEGSLGGATGQVPEGEDGEEDGAATLNNEQPAPGVVDAVGLDAEDAEGQQAAERVGDVAGGVEDGEAAGELPAPVERRLVVDDEREEGRLGYAQEPPQREHAPELVRRRHQQRARPEAEHQDR